MLQLRPYQVALDAEIQAAWASGARNVLATAPTGAGKTVTFSTILGRHVGAAVAIAHRQELVSQISLALATSKVQHKIIGPRSVIKFICQLHREELGGCYYNPNAPLAVAGIDTLVRRSEQLAQWCDQVTLWVLDEGHHLLTENKWGSGVGLFPNARGLGVTATPCRADGKGLGRETDGLFDSLVEGPKMRALIDQGFLTDYRIFAPPSDLDLSRVDVSTATGDFKHKQLTTAIKKSHLVGDVVAHYQRLAPGKLGVTFATDVETAISLAAEFNRAGVPAAAVSAKTPERERHHLIRRFRAGELRQLVNVDLFGEGFDLPALEVVSMARPTQSYPLYVQQFGRALRPLEGKGAAIIIDHVGNVVRHNGPPDFERPWSLDRRASARRGALDPDVIPMRVCAECTSPFEAFRTACPFCHSAYVPDRRDGPIFVDGDLVELDPATLSAMAADIKRVDENPKALRCRMEHAGAPAYVAASAAKQHRKRQEAQGYLRQLIALYGGVQKARGRSDSEAYKRFYFRYGVDVMSAQALGRPDAERLALRLITDLGGKA